MDAERSAWCSWCHTYTWRARLIRRYDDGTGVCSVFACPPCRAIYGLAPLGDRRAEVRR